MENWAGRTIAVACLFLCLAGRALGNDATAYLACTSLRIHPSAVTNTVGIDTLSISSLTDGTVNDELAFSNSESDPGSHAAMGWLSFGSPGGMTLACTIYLSVPDLGDVNLNSLTDFFEVARGLTNRMTDGIITYDDGVTPPTDGALEATWNRTEGRTTGTLSLRVILPGLGYETVFQPEFEIYQYQGIFHYSPGPNFIPATVQFNRLGLPNGVSNTIAGPVVLVRANDNELGFASSKWSARTPEGTNLLVVESSSAISTTIIRGAFPKTFEGLIPFDNGLPLIPSNGQYQYQLWYLNLFDPSDKNREGLPYLTTPVAPIRPSLEMALGPCSLNLTVVALPGQTVNVMQADSPASTTWTPFLTLQLNETSQMISLPMPSDAGGFFRAK